MDHKYQILADEFAKADEMVLDEIIREAEGYLGAQLTAALASDQRALVYSSIVGAVLAILMGGAATIAASTRDASPLLQVVVPMGLYFVVALILAILAARPVNWRPVGNNPRQWYDDVVKKRPLKELRAETAALYSRAIEENKCTMERNSSFLSGAMIFGGCGLIAGFFASIYIFASS